MTSLPSPFRRFRPRAMGSRSLAVAGGLVALAVTAAGLPSGSATAGTAADSASPTYPYCHVISRDLTQCIYAQQNTGQSFHVPWWQRQVTAIVGGANGAAGVGAAAAQGGVGSEVLSLMSVIPGSDFTVRVGSTPVSGSGAGGWPDGGFSRGGGGGGSSSILMGPANARVLVAGGGGGGGTRGWAVPDPGTPGRGGQGGLTGSAGLNGSNSPFTAGGGGGASASHGGVAGGGSSGAAVGGCPLVWMPAFSTPGAAGGTRGGAGGYLHFAGDPCLLAGGFGGGGGGGWYAGGGGGGGVNAGAGGGGGSSHAPDSGALYRINNGAFGGQGYAVIASVAPPGWTAEVAEPFEQRTYHAPVTASPRLDANGVSLVDAFSLDESGAAFHTSEQPDMDENLGGVFVAGSRLASVSWGAKRIDVVGRALRGGLFHNSWNGAGWAGWRRLTPDLSTSSNPTITSWGPGRLDVFARDEEGRLKHGWSDNGGAGWGWETFSGSIGGDPAAVSWGPGRIDIIAQAPASSSDLLVHKTWNGASWSDWSGLGTVAGGPRLTSAPTVVSRGPRQLDLWARDGANRMIVRTYRNGAWTGWEDRGLVPSRPGEPVAAVAQPGATKLVARGQLENELWAKVMP